ncbi:MAG: OmpA family protein [Deltaproteobacteria bacterium]|nr:OmpA family protein [Deltaproteobacteria bacterium]
METSLSKINELQATNVALMEKKKQLEEKTKTYDDLMNKMQKEIKAGKVAISRLKGRMTVSLKDKILFSSGQVKLNPEGKEALAKLAEVLKTLNDKVIQVEGHTDNIPIRSKRFPTNWELSTARALTVVRFLQKHGVDPSRLSAAGYGPFQPVASNDTPEGRSKNRRIEIVLLPDHRTEIHPAVKSQPADNQPQ